MIGETKTGKLKEQNDNRTEWDGAPKDAAGRWKEPVAGDTS